MSGHSKWSTIKHAKGAADAKRGKVFSKLSKEVTIAAKGGGDPDLNPRLRLAIANAKAQNMPNDNITRAIKRGTGDLEGVSYEDAIYEGYGPGGVAMLVEVITDNKNRSVAAARHLFSKNNGAFGETGSVAYLFDRKGEIVVTVDQADADKMLDLALEAGAEDLETHDEHHVILTASTDLSSVATALKESEIKLESEKLVFRPQTTTPVEDKTTAKAVLRLYELLDDWDDAQGVYTNFEISDDLLAEIAAEDDPQ